MIVILVVNYTTLKEEFGFRTWEDALNVQRLISLAVDRVSERMSSKLTDGISVVPFWSAEVVRFDTWGVSCELVVSPDIKGANVYELGSENDIEFYVEVDRLNKIKADRRRDAQGGTTGFVGGES